MSSLRGGSGFRSISWICWLFLIKKIPPPIPINSRFFNILRFCSPVYTSSHTKRTSCQQDLFVWVSTGTETLFWMHVVSRTMSSLIPGLCVKAWWRRVSHSHKAASVRVSVRTVNQTYILIPPLPAKPFSVWRPEKMWSPDGSHCPMYD